MTALTRFDRIDDLLPEMFRRIARPLQLDADFPADIRLDVHAKARTDASC